MSQGSSLALVLAAGQGTRMKSSRPKVLHEIAGQSMLARVMHTAQKSGFEQIAVVIAPGMDPVSDAARAVQPDAGIYVQEQQLGTAHAVLAARDALESFSGDVIILYGDTPLIRAETIRKIRDSLSKDADLAVLGFEARDPTGYGRLITDGDGTLVAVREHKDATDEERKIHLCNSGVFAFRGRHLPGLLERIGNDNAKGEYYLTDAVEVARTDGLKADVVVCSEEEVMGVNSKAQLAEAEAILQSRLRHEAMSAGVTLIAPETVFLSHDTKIGRDAVIEPNVVFGPGVTVDENARIRSFTYIEESHVGSGAIIGPFSRLRPGAELGENVRVGNFVEIKNSALDKGAKVNHLSYVGDADVGAAANIGAGTITCNYDGFSKHRTEIGPGAFIGSNTALVAPIKIGDGVYVGSGSVLSKDVPADALVLTRSPLDQRDGWAARMRARHGRGKGNKT